VVWVKLQDVMERGRKAKESAGLCCKDARRETQEIHKSATAEVEETLVEAHKKFPMAEAREEALTAREGALRDVEGIRESAAAEAKRVLVEAQERLASVVDREEAFLTREKSVSSLEEGASLKLQELDWHEEKLAKAIAEAEQIKLKEQAIKCERCLMFRSSPRVPVLPLGISGPKTTVPP
jgi:hypothetical protein